jgi:hypothetical protein
MRIDGQMAGVILNNEGRQILALAAVNVPDNDRMLVSIEESEDLGLWIRVSREDQLTFFLLRWEYILGVELLSGRGRVVGLTARKDLG